MIGHELVRSTDGLTHCLSFVAPGEIEDAAFWVTYLVDPRPRCFQSKTSLIKESTERDPSLVKPGSRCSKAPPALRDAKAPGRLSSCRICGQRHEQQLLP